MSRYTQVYDGEWFRPVMRGFKDACCDCSLVHTVNFRIVNGHVEFQVFRDARATAAIRRSMKKKPKP